jgi:hypothetical protein
MLEHFTKRPLMNPYRQIAILVEFRPLAHANYLSLLFSSGKSNIRLSRRGPTAPFRPQSKPQAGRGRAAGDG